VLAAYCTELSDRGVTLEKEELVGGPGFAYENWACAKNSGEEELIANTGASPSMAAACEAANPSATVYAYPTDPNSAFSWGCYTIVPPSTVTKVEPGEGPEAGSTHVTIKGEHLEGATEVRFGSAAASEVHVVSATELTVKSPAHAPGTVDVVVLTPGGESTKVAADHFTYQAPTSQTPITSPISTPIFVAKTASVPVPALAVSGNVAPVSGTVLVKLPGSSSFVPLTSLRNIPFGTVIEATHGKVTVTTVGPHGELQSMTFFEGQFKLTQGKNGQVLAELNGGNFSVCPTARERTHIALASSKHASPKHVVRKLWAEGHGSYSTKGNYAAGAVLGTRWLTEDLCDGTLIRVATDKVAVTNLVNHRKKTVKAGRHYLAKAP
jgi:hypothetical protein